jgi:hypothetical protein
MIFADALALEIGAGTFLGGACLISGAVFAGLITAGLMVRSSLAQLGVRLSRHDDQHAEFARALAVLAAQQQEFHRSHQCSTKG